MRCWWCLVSWLWVAVCCCWIVMCPGLLVVQRQCASASLTLMLHLFCKERGRPQVGGVLPAACRLCVIRRENCAS